MASPETSTPEPISSGPIALTAFTDHKDPDLFRILMGCSMGFDVTIEQMDDLTPSGHIQIRIHAIGPTPADAQQRVADLVGVLSDPETSGDVATLAATLAAHMESNPSPIIASSQARHLAAQNDADPRETEPPRQ